MAAVHPGRDYVGWAFEKVARRWPSDALLMINEVTSFNCEAAATHACLAQVRDRLTRGETIRGAGLQRHFFSRPALGAFLSIDKDGPTALLVLYEAFAGLNRPLSIAEITTPSAEFGGKATQAEVGRDLYRLLGAAGGWRAVSFYRRTPGKIARSRSDRRRPRQRAGRAQAGWTGPMELDRVEIHWPADGR